MNFLICGLGSIGARHARVLRQIGGHSIWAVRSGVVNGIRPFLDGLEIDRSFTELSEALNAAPDAVLVTNPTSLHVKTAFAAVERKIAVFIEKPLGHTKEGVEALVRAVNEHAVPVLVGFNMLYHPAFEKVRALLREGVIGEVVSSSAHWGTYLPDWHPWEDYRTSYAAQQGLGGGAVLTLSHELNYLTDLFGPVRQSKSVRFKKKVLDITADEGAAIILEHVNGVVSSVHLSLGQRPQSRTLDIAGEKGRILWDYNTPQVVVESPDARTVLALGSDVQELLDLSYLAQMRHFIKVVRKEEPSRVPVAKGAADLNVCLDILKEQERP